MRENTQHNAGTVTYVILIRGQNVCQCNWLFRFVKKKMWGKISTNILKSPEFLIIKYQYTVLINIFLSFTLSKTLYTPVNMVV